MRPTATKPITIESRQSLKRAAKVVVQVNGLTHTEALDEVARKIFGCKDYADFLNAYRNKFPEEGEDDVSTEAR
jgi:hypothetical protein